MSRIYDPDWCDEHDHYWDDDLQRSFPEEEDEDEETWRPVLGYEGEYEVSNRGRVRSLDRNINYRNGQSRRVKGKILTHTLNRGYPSVTLWRNQSQVCKKIHRLVSEAFIENPSNKTQVNHKDGNKTNNYAENLEWVTPKENQRHAFKTGLNKNSHARVLNSLQVRVIKRLLACGVAGTYIGEVFGVVPETIYSINHGRTWRNNASSSL